MILLSTSLLLFAVFAVFFTAQQGQQRLAQSRFASAIETAHDLEENLRLEAQALERDLHFITDLPLMNELSQLIANQFITDPQRENASNAIPPSPELWTDRQHDLFEGFLNANPSYLMMATCLHENNTIREIVRSERADSGLRPIQVSGKQLKSASLNQPDVSFFSELRPGSALLITGDQLPAHIPSLNRSPLVLIGIAGVYDSEGELIGLNMIELDLAERLKTLLAAIAPDYINVIVTDETGRILLDFRRGRFVATTGSISVVDRFPDSATVFGNEPATRELNDGRRFFCSLFQLGNSTHDSAQIGIVTHIAEEP